MKKSSIILGTIMAISLSATGASALSLIKFKDIPSGHWAVDAVYWAENKLIVSGYEDKTFRGDQDITRYETVQVLSNYNEMIQDQIESMSEELKSMKEEKEIMKKEIEQLKEMVDSDYFPIVDEDVYYGEEHLGAPIRYVCKSAEDNSRIYKHTTLVQPIETKYYDAEGNPTKEVETKDCQATTIEFYDSKVKG